MHGIVQVESFVRTNMQDTIPNYDNEGVDAAWDHLQTNVSECVHVHAHGTVELLHCAAPLIYTCFTPWNSV